MNYLIDLLNLDVVMHGVFLSLMLLNRNKNRLSNNILSMILMIVSICSFGNYLNDKELVISLYWISFIIIPLILINPPLIYFYILSATSSIKNFNLRQFLHFIPAASAGCFFLIGTIYYSFKSKSYDEMDIALHGLLTKSWLPISIFAMLSGIAYTAFSLYLLYLYKKGIQDYFSNIARLHISWLTIFLVLFLIRFSFVLPLLILKYSLHDFILTFNIASIIANLSCIYFTTAFALRQPDIFKYNRDMVGEVETAGKNLKHSYTKIKYEKNNIDDNTKAEYMHLLFQYMETSKPYLDENITLKKIANALSISPHHLSIAINDGLKQNFYSFINGYRINYVIEKLTDPENRNINILKLAFDAGFNSKTTFNTTFKAKTGMTPSAYRKAYLNETLCL